MKPSRVPRLDVAGEFRTRALGCCRLGPGEVWTDPVNGHRVAVMNAADTDAVGELCSGDSPVLVVNDPPYNVSLGTPETDALSVTSLSEYIEWCRQWVVSTVEIIAEMEVEACPAPNESQLDSDRLAKPERPPYWRMVENRSLRPVNSV